MVSTLCSVYFTLILGFDILNYLLNGAVMVVIEYLWNQCLSPLKLWVRTLFMARCTPYNIMRKICQWLATGWWFSLGTPVSSTNKTERHDRTEILLKVTLNTITQTHLLYGMNNTNSHVISHVLPVVKQFFYWYHFFCIV